MIHLILIVRVFTYLGYREMGDPIDELDDRYLIITTNH